MIAAAMPLEQAHRAFDDRQVDFMAVQRNGRVTGLCARGQIGFIMGARFGFALNSQRPVETVLVANPLIVTVGTPVREVLVRAMARQGEEFYQDVVLVDAERKLRGLIRVETLAQLQSRLVTEQVDELRRQHDVLRQQNLELFRASHAVRQSQGLYLGLFEGHTLGVALLDAQGGIHEHNRRLGEMLGLDEKSAVPISLAAWVVEKDRAAFLQLLDAHSRGISVAPAREFSLNLPARGTRLFRCSTGWIEETGQICACLDDITDQRMLERNVQRQEKQTLLDTLVGGIAHELNNKLTPVQGFAELLTLEGNEDIRRYTAYIKKSAAEAVNIIRQLLQLSKPIAPVPFAVDLRQVAEETIAMLRFQIREARCQVRTISNPSPVCVMADAAQLKQVAINLVLNALHAMENRPDGTLTLETRVADGFSCLVVSDNGNGIPKEIQSRIFDPFFTTKGPEKGSGLGLSICFSVVRQNHGEIAVESEPGAGARFTVSFPELDPRALQSASGEDAAPAPAARATTPRGVRVLVVEDEEVVRCLLQEMMRNSFQCQVDVAGNGAEALAALQLVDYALVLSDIRMPVMNGPELYEEVRQHYPEISRRFVFMTGHPGGQHLEEKIAGWNLPVIAKPFTVERIAEVCGPFLRGHGSGASQA
jgi:signal transduction histidine kinase